MKIIQIDGVKGLISAVVMVVCLFAGFVVSPGYGAMYLWNKFLVSGYNFPQIDLFQGILLWAIVVITYFILTSDGFAISFRNTPQLSDEELNNIIKSARMGSRISMMKRPMHGFDKFEHMKNNPFITQDNIVNSENKIDEDSEEKCSNQK